MKRAGPKQKIDYQAMEPAWRAGIKSPLQIATEYTNATGIPCSRSAVNKYFKQTNPIPRDLSAQVKAKARDIIARNAAERRAEARALQDNTPVGKSDKITDTQVIVAEAEQVAEIHLIHRKNVVRKRKLIDKLFEELEAATDGSDVIETCRLALESGELTKIAESVEKLTSLPERIKGVTQLVTAFKQVLLLEREVFNITDSDTPTDDTDHIPPHQRAMLDEVYKRG